MIAYKLGIIDHATPAVRSLRDGIKPSAINPIVGRAATNVTRDHFIQLNRERPNHLGGARTNYYLGAARGTSFTVVDDGVIISISQIGIRLRYYGGRVVPGKGLSSHSGKPTKFLTIPVHPRAHGKRASEFELELVYNHNGEPVALATKDSRGVSIRERVSKSGKKTIVKRQTGRRGEIMFVLKRSATHKPDPTILPAPDKIYGAAIGNLNAYVDRLLQRSAGRATP